MEACAQWRNQPPKPVADQIKAREATRIRYPEDGKFIGDWRRGEQLAQSGYGLRFTDTDAKRENGGNCYACHELSPDEVSFGTIGISLKGYGRIHKGGEQDARLVYDKIYNSQAVVACSLMPRFGANGILTIEQIKDLVALLMDPESPVNSAPGDGRAATTGAKGGAASGEPGKR
jgi:sulfur-oxidizing protein SoxX